jgi:hypothetical protein
MFLRLYLDKMLFSASLHFYFSTFIVDDPIFDVSWGGGHREMNRWERKKLTFELEEVEMKWFEVVGSVNRVMNRFESILS